MPPYPVVDVSRWVVVDQEPGGDDPKLWVHSDPTLDDEPAWLFKQVTDKTVTVAARKGGGQRSYRRGEDWAEKVSSELAHLIGLPAAEIDLAVREGRPGLISRNTKPDPSDNWTLTEGGILLPEVDSRYRGKTENTSGKNRIGHSIENVQSLLEGVFAPPGDLCNGLSGFDVFAGFLLFDAWIANQDRHEYNWAVLRSPDGQTHLSASFDHGSALGSGLDDEKRLQIVQNQGIDLWCRRGRAVRFEDCGNVGLVELAVRALGIATPGVLTYWRDRICAVQPQQWQTVLASVPSLSAPASTFVDEALRVNQRRICDEF